MRIYMGKLCMLKYVTYKKNAPNLKSTCATPDKNLFINTMQQTPLLQMNIDTNGSI